MKTLTYISIGSNMKPKIATYRWSEYELNLLRKLTKNKELTYYDLSELIGRTPKSIKWKLKLMRCPKKKKGGNKDDVKGTKEA